MAMFITFYSYKGGVGRTLAVANIAALLAKDQSDPCRVLVWDFDLPAPGLQDVVKCKWNEQKVGFVDYLDFYLRNAQVDDITKYVYKTSIPNVDVLPAGFMGAEYARRLEDIQWQEIYEEAQGYQLIERTKKQISLMQPAYDYVLIDSLTGYSDVGGICVNQLGDAVVLIFRLNHQNMEGISKVYRSVGAYAKREGAGDHLKSVVPVISPAWPFAATESNEWFQKAKRVFGNRRIYTLSFEGSMMLGEKVLSAADEHYAIEPPILRDYRVLTSHLRSLNQQDPKTVYKLAKKSQEQDQFPIAIELLGNLTDRRPEVEQYWRDLTTTVQTAPARMRKQILPSVNEIIRRGCDAQKPWAYVAKAWLTESTESDWNAAYEDLGKAIGLEPDNANLYFARAMSQLYHRQYTGAEQDLKRALDLGLQGSRLPYAHFHLGHCNRILGDYTEALQHLSRAIKMQPNDTSFLYGRALTLYATGRYSDAELEIEKAIKTDPAKENTKILGAHVAASLGKAERAAEILDSVRSQVEIAPILSLSLAEAYLVILPEETLRILDAYPEIVKDNNAIASFLRAFAAVLLNAAATSGEETIDIARTDSPQEETIWEVTELEEFLKWASAAGQISESQHTTLSKLVKATGWSHRAA